MSCYRCAEKFRLFKKEIGCGNCGFSFCAKCCENKINVPKKNNKLLNVCQNCYNLIKNETDKVNSLNKDISPPKNFFKIVESNRLKQNNNEQDPEVKSLEKRLESLNKSTKNVSVPDSTLELETRLNNLQGRSEQYQKLSNLPTKEIIKTPEDLISKLTEEVSMDKEYEEFERKEMEKLENRLKILKQTEKLNSNEGENKKDELDKNEQSSNKTNDPNDELMKKILFQAEESLKNSQTDNDIWCCLCNNDADLKCIDCENDLYCKRCFKQVHCTAEYKNHRKTDL